MLNDALVVCPGLQWLFQPSKWYELVSSPSPALNKLLLTPAFYPSHTFIHHLWSTIIITISNYSNLLLAMLFLTTILSVLAISPASGFMVPRDANSINAALTTISNQVSTLNATLNTFNGGAAGTLTALKIQGQATDLKNDVDKAASAAQSSSALSDADSASVAYGVVALAPKIYSVLDNIVRKKPAFDTAIVGIGSASGLVKQDLIDLKKATDAFGGNLTGKFVPSVAKVAPLLIGAIDFHFDQALKVYN